jgi:hypothetical protein
MIGKLFLLALAILANLYVFLWHKYAADEKQLALIHKVFVILFAIGAVTNLFMK